MSRPGDWNCRSCQYSNFKRRDSCQMCGHTRPGFVPPSFGSNPGPDVRPGDWYCAVINCGAQNYASRSICFKCGGVKDDSSSSGFDGHKIPLFGLGNSTITSRSGWKSGDWICTRYGCNEHNFASRMECYKCNAPRDFSSSKN